MKPYLLVSGDFVPTGGMDRANHALALFLARRGHPVHLVTHRADPDLLGLDGVTVHRVPKPAGSYLLGEPLLNWAGRRWAGRIARQGGRVLVNGGNCPFEDINWVHYVHAAYRPTVRSGLLRWFAGCWARRSAVRGERKALRRARLVLANSERTRRDLLERLNLDEKWVRTVYYGIDAQVFRPISRAERAALREKMGWPAERPLVVFIGALGDRRKGFDTVFAAWQRLCARSDWDADLVVIGTGAELPAWQAWAREAGLATRVRFLGLRRDVPALLPACDVLVAPTRYEAYGLGVHEALCCGLPTLVSAGAGVAERYPAALRNWLLPDPDDAVDLAERLAVWRDSPQANLSALQSFAADLSGRTWDVMAADIVALAETCS
jgi:glycosyltransferase involved in cell wall biosynthesis